MTQHPADFLQVPLVHSVQVPSSLRVCGPGRIMHTCKERGRISELLHHSLMMRKDKMEATEKILSLTLEIIFLLTGEDFVLRKKEPSSDDCQLCLSEGRTKDPSSGEEPPRPAQEVPLRCEDVAIFFSTEEWEYLEGHKERYKDVVSGDQPPPASADTNRVTAPDEGKDDQETIQVDLAATITDAPLTAEHIPTKPPESSSSPRTSDICMEDDIRMIVEEYQAPPEEETAPPQCKEEDVPVEISSGDPRPVTSPEIVETPICSQDCIEEEKRMIPQECEVKSRDNMLPNWFKKKTNPSKIGSGPPTSWKIQPDSPHLLIPVHRKKGVNSSTLEGRESPPSSVMVKPKTVLNETLPLKSRLDLPHQYWQKPQIDASSSSLVKYKGGAVNLPTVLETPTGHKCLQCGRGFRNEIDLISHQRTHKKMFHCALCQQSFMDKSSLVVHEWTFHIHEPKTGESQPKQATKEDRPFSCAECGKFFMKKSSLVKHQRIHTGAFACPDCGKCLSDKTGLIIHRRTHTGEKPYACSECGRRFTQRCHLITHQSVHTSKESFACSECGKCFSVRSVLEAHQAFHNRHKPLTCSDCGKCFKQWSALMAHSRVHEKESDSTS